MIISKVPFRMSFFGGGTDFPAYFKNSKGAVISTTFDKYCYVNVRHLPRFFDYENEFVYSQTERISDIEKTEHPLIRETMKMLDMHEIKLSYDADLPARSGLGTSSAFAVGMLLAFYALKDKYISKKSLAKKAIILEREKCDEKGGWQDQIACSYGGLNKIVFSGDDFNVEPIIMNYERKKQLNDNLLLFFTGFTHNSSDVIKNSKASTKKNDILKKMYSLVDKAYMVLTDNKISLDDFGDLLNESWELKRSTGSGISTSAIDSYYTKALKAGAKGGKLLGAGGGGFLLLYVTPDRKKEVMAAMRDLLYIPFSFENEGARIIYYNPEVWAKE